VGSAWSYTYATAAARSLCGRAKARDWVYVVDAPAAVEG
jgi:hypothetical protein